MKVAYCTGFWCTNIGNGFFSLGVEYVLKKILGAENVTVVSDYQTLTQQVMESGCILIRISLSTSQSSMWIILCLPVL